ncbi:glycosyltransferase family 2 protein [Leifsonia sp. Leaf264]|uniref:glycosyltransferase family 2 protein n=1 Tax=Leifsonia sp. Leaf264 TaxID=1736314 RepID=UPI0006F87E94|nr:glycosyltransferase family 2 protein [Leifsonia sp. Leaf264]KQP02056.1 hypothetical protein ASF30_04625 [Leifsonia sp. Leaf264]
MSVVIPVKDDAAQLERCLVALRSQSIDPFEVIVVDNGSTDDTASVAQRFGARVVFEPSAGIGIASAAGYNAATGDILARLDADSIPVVDWVETVSSTFSVRDDVAAITGPAHFTDGPRWLRAPAALAYLGSYFALTGMALGHVPLFGSNLALRRHVWHSIRDEVHLHDALTHDDLDLSFHIGVRNSIRYIPALRAGISIRPLSDGRGALRWRRGIHTVVMHWPHDLPWLRIARRAVFRARVLVRSAA